MSDSELSDAPSHTTPSDAQLEGELRLEVRKAHKAEAEYTVRSIRNVCQENLGLSASFFKDHLKWKSRSSNIIKDESKKLQSEQHPQTADGKATSASIPKNGATQPNKPAKRQSSSSATRPRKKVRRSSDSEESASVYSGSELEDRETKKAHEKKAAATSLTSRKSSAVVEINSDMEETSFDDEEAAVNAAGSANQQSESELSDVLDEEPPKKRKGKSKETITSSAKAKTTKTKTSPDEDPDKEEIKKLQGQLAKCGVRKVWGKELKPYETSRAKIKYLRTLLSDLGISGRFSNEKAAQIKEARELAADIEAVQEGAQRWGKSDDEEDGGELRTRGGRRLVRGAKHYDFLSSDGEETD